MFCLFRLCVSLEAYPTEQEKLIKDFSKQYETKKGMSKKRNTGLCRDSFE